MLVVALGGGSCIDAAKAIEVLGTNPGSIVDYEGSGKVKNPKTPMIAIPTTAGTGSELTWVAVRRLRHDVHVPRLGEMGIEKEKFEEAIPEMVEEAVNSSLFLPSRSTGYVCDPTPGRHTATPMSRLDAGSAEIAPYPELQFHNIERYEYKSKGPASATASCYWQVGTCAGVCLFPVIFFGTYPLLEFLNAVTGWDMDLNEALKTGARVQTLRQCFNLREGVAPSAIKLPGRMAGLPPATDGPFAGRTLDTDSLEKEFRKAMGFDPHTGRPTQVTMDRLGLTELVAGRVAQVRFDEGPVNVGRQ